MGLGVEFGLDVGKLRSAHAGAGRVAALRHEAVDHAMKHDAVIKAFLGQRGDAFDVAGRQIRAQLDDDIAAAIECEGERFVGHEASPFWLALGCCPI